MTNKAMQKSPITVEINPLQISVLMDVLHTVFPQIRHNFEEHTSHLFTLDYDAIEATISDIYTACFAETELTEDAKRVFNATGAYPDIYDLIKNNVNPGYLAWGAGKTKPVTIEVVPMYAAFSVFVVRYYIFQILEIINREYAGLVESDLETMMGSINEIYDKSIALTNIKEKLDSLMDAFNTSGKRPDIDKTFVN